MNGVRTREIANTAKPSDSRSKDKTDESGSSTRKRRDRDEEDSHRDRERKRSKLDYSELAEDKENHARSRHRKREETETSSKHHTQRTLEKPTEISKPSAKKTEMDHHELEREARNRERLLKELQRREAMEGKPPAGKRDSQVNGRVAGGGRRVSYKYEDEETNEARATRVESEREAVRWG